MGVDFDIFDDEPSKSVGQPPSPKSAPKSAPTRDDIDVPQLETTSPTKEALFNAETQERIEQAKATAKAHAKVAARASAHLARRGGMKVISMARKAMAYRFNGSVVLNIVLVALLAAVLITIGLVWAANHFWLARKPDTNPPSRTESAAPAKGVATTAVGDVRATTPVHADKTSPHAGPKPVEKIGPALATKAPEAPKQPPALVGHVSAQRAKPHTAPTPKPTTQQNDEPTSDWKQKANDEMDAYFKELNNKE